MSPCWAGVSELLGDLLQLLRTMCFLHGPCYHINAVLNNAIYKILKENRTTSSDTSVIVPSHEKTRCFLP